MEKFGINNVRGGSFCEKKLCEENNISIQKKSDKTLKMINKLKDELIIDLLKV